MIVVQQLTDDTKFVEIGRVDNGTITEGKEALTAIDDEEVWTTYSPAEIEQRFDGPIVVATEVDDDAEVEGNDLSARQATGRVRQLAVPDGAVPIKDRSEAPEGAQIIEGNRGGLYYLPPGDGDGEATADVEPSANDATPDAIADAISSDVLDRPSGGLEDLRTQVRGAEGIDEAHDILERELDPAEIEDLGQEIVRQQEFDLMPTSERLTNAFELAETRETYRDRGGTGGNTTADSMEVLEYRDGSEDYATPVSAYENIQTRVVASPFEAQRNNRLSPKVINQLGGTAAEAVVTEGPDGEDWIVKEGMEGKTHAEFKGPLRLGYNILDKTDDPEALQDSARETLTSAYFTGNRDLHPGNLYIDTDTNTYSIIDHDNATSHGRQGVHNLDDFLNRDGLELDEEESRAMIYDKAIDIREGNVDIDGIDNKAYAGYVEAAADTAARRAALDGHDFGDAEVPEELQGPPDGIETIEELKPESGVAAYDISVVNNFGDTENGQLLVPGKDRVGEPRVTGAAPFTDDKNVPLINRLTAIRPQ